LKLTGTDHHKRARTLGGELLDDVEGPQGMGESGGVRTRHHNDMVSFLEHLLLAWRVAKEPSAVDDRVDSSAKNVWHHGSQLPIQAGGGVGTHGPYQDLQATGQLLDLRVKGRF
jgi:hypothetical protein